MSESVEWVPALYFSFLDGDNDGLLLCVSAYVQIGTVTSR